MVAAGAERGHLYGFLAANGRVAWVRGRRRLFGPKDCTHDASDRRKVQRFQEVDVFEMTNQSPAAKGLIGIPAPKPEGGEHSTRGGPQVPHLVPGNGGNTGPLARSFIWSPFTLSAEGGASAHPPPGLGGRTCPSGKQQREDASLESGSDLPALPPTFHRGRGSPVQVAGFGRHAGESGSASRAQRCPGRGGRIPIQTPPNKVGENVARERGSGDATREKSAKLK